MTTAGPRSGKFGYVNGATQVRNWSLSWNEALVARMHSASRAGTERITGVEDWNGTFEGFGGLPGTAMFPGDSIALKLFPGPDDGIYGHTGLVWIGTAIVESVTINWDWQPSNSINWSLAFAANGCLTSETNEYYDATTECAASMCSLGITYGNQCSGTAGTSIEFETWANLQSATLTITSQNQPVVNSSTACCTLRRPGPIDWTLSVVDQEQYPVLDFATAYALRLYTTAAAYWQLGYGLLQDVSDIRVDVESGAIITKTNNLAMTGRICCADEGTLTGWIIDPAGTVEWPVALSV